ncbi:MAG: hypothetical protein KKA19_08715 [Candidatus Margulisbacteria bacterium]|nr:hypothetical protein [Candidatus Margulisiibacteriota bacterium]
MIIFNKKLIEVTTDKYKDMASIILKEAEKSPEDAAKILSSYKDEEIKNIISKMHLQKAAIILLQMDTIHLARIFLLFEKVALAGGYIFNISRIPGGRKKAEDILKAYGMDTDYSETWKELKARSYL